jgi:hypothetical protein
MNRLEETVRLTQARVANHAHQTRGFRWDYLAATDDEVFETTVVLQETLDAMSNVILKIVQPRELPAVRRQIAYLQGLRQRQAEVWAKKLQDFETRLKNTNEWLRKDKTQA